MTTGAGTWRWLTRRGVIYIHSRQVGQFGGGQGIRDEGLLDSALARPVNKAAYGAPDAADLAAAYAYGIARNHPFVDGNKRTAYVAAAVFLSKHGFALTATVADVVLTFLALAAGEMTEEGLADWFRANTEPA